MGRVYLARVIGGQQLVALKTIRPELSKVSGYRERFAREIEVARSVRSAYIAQLIDFDPDAEVPWLTTELVLGPNLAEVLASHGPLPADSVRGLAAGLAEALDAIHAAGIVHRDVKPSNVLLTESGPRLVDFGVARPVRQAGLTSTGQFVGTSAYASPEQLLGQKVGPLSDMFSLGVLLTETAGAGAGPVAGPVAGASERQSPAVDVIEGRIPALSSLPQDLRAVVRECLARDPADRPSPAELPGMLAGRPRPDRQSGRPWLPAPVFSSVRRSSESL
ncbi:serine/threonine-protein kinase, partial [Streptomyces neyagawaensis]